MDVNSTATRFGEDDEIELELCLSLGGSLKKTEKPKPKESEKPAGDGSTNDFAVDVGGGACVDARSKREIHAVRRQEARKKREAKQQQRRGLCRPRNGEFPNGVVWNCAAAGQWDCKRMRIECNGTLNDESNGVNLNLNVDQNGFTGPLPVSRVRYPYPYPVPNYSLFVNHPCGNTTPFPAQGNDGKTKNLVHPQDPQQVGTGYGSGQIEDNVKLVSNGSPVCSSSAISDSNCSTRQGGSSCDSGTNSRHTKPDQAPVNNRPTTGSAETEQSTERSNGSLQETQQTSNISRENGKPPKPSQNGNGVVNGNADGSSLPFAQMPCVTTTGDGPEGKTVNGFLYRYSKTEISIVCVCHGQSFSPAEFIRHAGGTDVLHPLRHITVVPSTF